MTASLPRFDQLLLQAAGTLVPAAQRDEWHRSWQAELWHKRHRTRTAASRRTFAIADLALGLLLDALWLRAEDWRRALRGTALLCLVSLGSMCALSALAALALHGSSSALAADVADQFRRFLFAAPLVVFVTFAVAPRRPVEHNSRGTGVRRLRRRLFFATKSALLLLLTFLLSTTCCEPLSHTFPNTADFLQVLVFVFFAVIGLRWTLDDQERRCKYCLRVLAAPARVGRPSHNLLEWNGTEMACARGHGRLSVPELETSWCRSSEWKSQGPHAQEIAV